MFISTSAKVNLARNQAKELGGAIYVSNPRNTYMCGIGTERVVLCSIQVLPDSSSEDCQLFSITFNQNKARVAGNTIYGDKTSACLYSKVEMTSALTARSLIFQKSTNTME